MEDSKNYFNEIAPEWDKMQNSFFSDEVRQVAYALADIQAGTIAADIGAGTGFMTEGLLQQGLKVIAVDQSPDMLEQLQQKYHDYDHLTCLVSEGNALPIENSSVDYAFANMFLHHVNDPQKAIDEMYRILKPGGKLVITDLDEHEFTFLKTEQHDVWMGFDRDQVKLWFKQAGFKSVEISCVGCNCCSDSSDGHEKAAVSIFAAFGIK